MVPSCSAAMTPTASKFTRQAGQVQIYNRREYFLIPGYVTRTIAVGTPGADVVGLATVGDDHDVLGPERVGLLHHVGHPVLAAGLLVGSGDGGL